MLKCQKRSEKGLLDAVTETKILKFNRDLAFFQAAFNADETRVKTELQLAGLPGVMGTIRSYFKKLDAKAELPDIDTQIVFVVLVLIFSVYVIHIQIVMIVISVTFRL